MRLIGFSVRNFRSIIDSGNCPISPEDITTLIGQNEAGKSSILEALIAFQKGRISPDDLRSDGSLPMICCTYECSQPELQEIISKTCKELDITEPHAPSTAAKFQVCAEWSSRDEESSTYNTSWIESTEVIKSVVEGYVTISYAKEHAEQDPTTVAPISDEFKSKKIAIAQEKLTEVLLKNLPEFILFEEDPCLLPSKIDVNETTIQDQKGSLGATNFLKVAGLDLEVLLKSDERHMETMIAQGNQRITTNFQSFWTQYVGKEKKVNLACNLKIHDNKASEEKRGRPYLVFYIHESQDKLYPSQRSKGMRWFVSFFLQVWAAAARKKSVIFLFDEPGANLHSKAQQNVLQVLETSCNANQIIYSTHNPDLIRLDRLGRVLAVQRDDAELDSSPTRVIGAHALSGASADTMSAIYRAMGIDFSRQQIIARTNNVLVEELSAVYYLKAFFALTHRDGSPNFLPCTGASNIPMMANLLTGWGIEFIVLLDDDSQGRLVRDLLKKDLFFNSEELCSKRLYRNSNAKGIEDIFSKHDFEKYGRIQT